MASIFAKAPFNLFWELPKIQHSFCSNTAAFLKYRMDFVKIYMQFDKSKINLSKGLIYSLLSSALKILHMGKNHWNHPPHSVLVPWRLFSLISTRFMAIFHLFLIVKGETSVQTRRLFSFKQWSPKIWIPHQLKLMELYGWQLNQSI